MGEISELTVWDSKHEGGSSATVAANISAAAATKYGIRYLVYTSLNYSKGLLIGIFYS